MARTITEIQDDIINRIKATAGLADLNSTSKVAVWRLWTYIVAVSVWALENLFDLHKNEVNTLINEKAPHSLRWYANKAKDFQYGSELVAEEDYYDNTGLSEEDVAEQKIIAFSAVVEQAKGLRLKVARIVNGDLDALSTIQLPAFEEYMNRIKDAGVNPLVVESLPADSLKLSLTIYYNPLVLDNTGSRLDGTDPDPVGKKVREYLKTLPFNGTMVLAYLVDALQQVDGVVIPHIEQAQARYGSLPYTAFDVKYSPDAGYLRILNATDLTISYIPQSAII
ncbi:nucleotidyltransferase [Chitinophaga tropicalis]|uniref:Nucleotidyltransferase n=1 Tax=Chitinophaga tropicalis TaxID=2683588 RepID=A0A7K1U7A2_9BACT|nr:nucleotidyltransferase [Chitinophaga tropicalis]MVT09875.1 nucleotidyltransferase [Chitinophaga tropicalis]